MKMKGRKIVYWIGALLLTVPLGVLINYAEEVERAQPGALSGQIAAVGVYLFLGAYIALYRLLPMFGREGRWRMGWPRAVVGVLFVVLGVIARWYFSLGKPPVTEAANMLFVIGGYLLATAIEKPAVPDAAQSDGERRGA